MQSTDTDSTIGFQYFTTSKEQNSLSLGYSATNVYTEMSKITAASGGTTVEVGTAGGDFIIDKKKVSKLLCEAGHAVPYFGGSKKDVEAKHMANRHKLVDAGVVEGPLE